MSSAVDIAEDFMSIGSGARLGLTMLGYRDDYTRFQDSTFLLSTGVFDLATSRVLPPRALKDIATLIDPINRRTTPSDSLEYYPGPAEALASRIPGLTKLLPPSGKITANAATDSPKTRMARAELSAMGLERLAYRESIDPKTGKIRASYVKPELIYKVPGWKALIRQAGFNLKPVPSQQYRDALAGVEE
jgi:hypothetical protein